MSAAEELLQFLKPSAATEAKGPAICYLLGMTATEDGLKLFREKKSLIIALCVLASEEKNPSILAKTYETLLNLSSYDDIASTLLQSKHFVRHVLDEALFVDKRNCQKACALLSNLSQTKEENAQQLWSILADDGDRILEALCTSKENDSLQDHLAFLFSNLSMIAEVRGWFMDREQRRIEKLLPFMTLSTTATRKFGVVGTIRNCTFDTEHHQWLLEEVAILPRLLFPLIGSEVEQNLDDEDMEQLPIDCQYLGTTKKVEESGDIRKLLIESLHQLCATRFGRKFLKANGVYFVLRELHKVEAERSVVVACENLVDILIQDEPEHDNLKEVDVPSDLVEKFNKMDQDALEED